MYTAISDSEIVTCAVIWYDLDRERVTRERLRDLSVLERLYGNPTKSSTDLAVKKVRLIYHSFGFHVCGPNQPIVS